MCVPGVRESGGMTTFAHLENHGWFQGKSYNPGHKGVEKKSTFPYFLDLTTKIPSKCPLPPFPHLNVVFFLSSEDMAVIRF